jgi:hypothetical protein
MKNWTLESEWQLRLLIMAHQSKPVILLYCPINHVAHLQVQTQFHTGQIESTGYKPFYYCQWTRCFAGTLHTAKQDALKATSLYILGTSGAQFHH